MSFLVTLAGFLFVFVVLPRLVGGGRARLLKSGLEARGLVLSAARTGTTSTVNGQRFQVRSIVLDVEVPGRAPYEVSLNASFPRLCESFPGSALDLRVDPRNPNNIHIVGPAGSSGWMGATVGIFPWAVKPGASGCGMVFVVLVSVLLGIGAVVQLIAAHTSDSDTPAVTPETPPVTPHVVPPTPRVTPTADPLTSHKICEEAVRCCETLGRPHCQAFATVSETMCKGVLAEESKAAAKVHKACK